MRVLAHQTRAVQHGDINASTHAQSVMGPECSNDHKGRGLSNVANEHPLALRTECSTTPKLRNVILSAYMHICNVYNMSGRVVPDIQHGRKCCKLLENLKSSTVLTL